MNEPNPNLADEEFKLIPLASGQHAVATVPKTTTDFPFFYLTKRKERLSKPILYEGVDGEGRPVRWAATPNASIGTPGIDAHELWTRLVKPTWEAYRSSDDHLPNILPLGGVRQCLRVVGWGVGGWEARRLLRALNQIGATWCTADFSVPTSELDGAGKPKFRVIKGSFSRFTIFAIGEKHLTEEELKDGKFSFDFDLEDTLYIQFSPLEVAIQESQPQRYLDNQYMFSVAASARRWYELMAAKIFGVVKNRGEYCEVMYSWYVKHHHTLNRLIVPRRIVQQMNEVIHDHLESGFIERVEYRKIREPGQQIDFRIRFFPGLAAKQSVARVASVINNKRTPPGDAPRIYSRKRAPELLKTKNMNSDVEIQASPAEPIEAEIIEAAGASELVTRLVAELVKRGIFRSQAVRLLSSVAPAQLAQVDDYIEYWDTVFKVKAVTAGLLYDLIRNGDPLPPSFETQKQRHHRQAAEEERRKASSLEKALEFKYAEFIRQCLDRFISEKVPAGEFERRVGERATAMGSESEFWSARPDMATRLAYHEVRAEMLKSANLLTYEEFRRVEMSAAPAQADVESPPIAEPESETNDISLEAQNEAISGIVFSNEGSPISEENSSPQGI